MGTKKGSCVEGLEENGRMMENLVVVKNTVEEIRVDENERVEQ